MGDGTGFAERRWGRRERTTSVKVMRRGLRGGGGGGVERVRRNGRRGRKESFEGLGEGGVVRGVRVWEDEGEGLERRLLLTPEVSRSPECVRGVRSTFALLAPVRASMQPVRPLVGAEVSFTTGGEPSCCTTSSANRTRFLLLDHDSAYPLSCDA